MPGLVGYHQKLITFRVTQRFVTQAQIQFELTKHFGDPDTTIYMCTKGMYFVISAFVTCTHTRRTRFSASSTRTYQEQTRVTDT